MSLFGRKGRVHQKVIDDLRRRNEQPAAALHLELPAERSGAHHRIDLTGFERGGLG